MLNRTEQRTRRNLSLSLNLFLTHLARMSSAERARLLLMLPSVGREFHERLNQNPTAEDVRELLIVVGTCCVESFAASEEDAALMRFGEALNRAANATKPTAEHVAAEESGAST